MKSFKIVAPFLVLFLFVQSVFAQTKTATFKVWGNCGMCKKTIESAARQNGATTAVWSEKTKMITVKYAAAKTSVDKIQKGIANAGYDNDKYTGSDEAYNNLHECCQYDRKGASTSAAADACCMKDGKCTGTMDCCKKIAGKSDCCEKGTCAKEGGCCAKCDMKDGHKCSMAGKEGHKCGEGKCDHKEAKCEHKDGKCEMKDGKCCQKEGMTADCCKDGKCSKGGDCCKDQAKCKGGGCCKKDAVAACCKDGKCEKGGDCCKDNATCKEKGCCKS